jgi:hypothetical protein
LLAMDAAVVRFRKLVADTVAAERLDGVVTQLARAEREARSIA